LRVGVAVLAALIHTDAGAQELAIVEIPYSEIVTLSPTRTDFESYAHATFGSSLRIEGATVGPILSGQTLQIKPGRGHGSHYVLEDTSPDLPLSLSIGREQKGGAVVFDEAFTSFALAGQGPPQSIPNHARIGTGTLTLLFDEPQCFVGFRTWLDGAQDNIVMRSYPEGNINLLFWNEKGKAVSDRRRFLDHGLIALGYAQQGGGPPEIKAITIQNLDPGGIAIDDLIFSPVCPWLIG
jgi:hypothetical protein